jgi:hypothetical protein
MYFDGGGGDYMGGGFWSDCVVCGVSLPLFVFLYQFPQTNIQARKYGSNE